MLEKELFEMEPPDAVDFFQKQGVRGTRPEIKHTCSLYGYHPLSLRLLAGLIMKDKRQPMDIVAASRYEQKVATDARQRQHHVLEQSYTRLSPESKALLGRIACFRSSVPYDTLVAITKDDPLFTSLDDSLNDLTSRGLLHVTSTPKADPQSPDFQTASYDLHPIVRRFAYDQLTAPERTGAHVLLVVYFEAIPPPPKVQKLEDLAPIIELYHHMVRAGNLDEAADLLENRLIPNPLYYQFGAYQLCVELLRALFLDGENKPPRLKDENAHGWTLNILANVYAVSGQPRRAVSAFQSGIVLAEKIGNKKNAAIGLGNVACMAQIHIGALREAERNLRRRIELCREIADENRESTGHFELGRVLTYLGQWEESEKALNTGEEIKKKTNRIQAQSVIWSYRALRFLLLAREDAIFDTRKTNNEYRISVIEAAKRALGLADEFSRTNFRVERDYVRVYRLLGAAYCTNNDLTLAEENSSKALNLCRQINAVDHEAEILLDLARLRYAQGDFKDAHEKASEALMITERCNYVLQGADVNLFLAQYALEQEKDQAKAKQYAEEAKKLATCDGPPYYYKVAYEEAERFLENLGG